MAKNEINTNEEMTVDNTFTNDADERKEQEALLEQRRKSFNLRAVPKMKTIIVKMRELAGLKQFERALSNGAVTQDAIDKMEAAIRAEWKSAKETLEYLRDLETKASAPARSKGDIEFSL